MAGNIIDIPALITKLPLAIYSNLNDQISADTPSPLPAGKVYHRQIMDDIIVSAINRITDDPLLNLRTWNAPRICKPEETAVGVVGKQIYLNVSGGNLVNVDPEIPGNSGTAGEPWYPLTGGAALTFDIPLWNDSGIVEVAGVPVNTGAFFYPHLQIVRAENGLYQRNDVTLPVPVSNNFLTEYAAGKWIFLGTWISITNTSFRARALAGQLSANRTYLITDVINPQAPTGGATLNVLVKATSGTNYSRDGWVIADYTGAAPLRNTIEMEAVKYDAVTNKCFERTDNYGTFARQTSTDVNHSTNPANSVDRVPWGHNQMNNNSFDNWYIANAWTLSKIASMKNNHATNQIHTNGVPTTTIAFNDNNGYSGTFITGVATTTFAENDARSRAIVSATGDLERSHANGLNCTNSSSDSYVTGNNSTMNPGAARGLLHGVGAVMGTSSVDCTVIGTSAGTGNSNVSTHLIGAGAASAANVPHGYGLGNHALVNKESVFVIGKYGIGNINNALWWGWANQTDLTAGSRGEIGGGIVPLGLTTTDATPTPLITLHNPITGGSSVLVIPTTHVWIVEFHIFGTNGLTDISCWYGNFMMINTGGVITYPGQINYQITTSAWAQHVSTPAVRSIVGGAMGGIVFGSTGATPTITAAGIAATNINWSGRLLISQGARA